VEEKITAVVLDLARRRQPGLTQITPEQVLTTELGLESLDLAQLVAVLEEQLGVDPFATTAMTNVRTVGDLCAAYRKVLC
jgi:acyl carrier protein